MWTILWVGSAAWGATLDVAWAGTGRYVVSAAGWGSASDAAGDVWIDRPEGSELVRAFVVLAASPEAGDPGASAVEVGGSSVTLSEAGSAGVGPAWARWGDVTAEAGPAIDALPAGGGTLVLEEVALDPLQTEGLGLLVVWAAADAPLATAMVSLGSADLYDGASLAAEVDASGLTSAELGLGVAFSGDADFSGITTSEPLHIADVVHQAFVKLDETGTEAAAATAVLFERDSAIGPDQLKTATFDRPFVFLVRDNATGAVVFLGHLVSP